MYWGCKAESNNNLVAPCGTSGCCDLGNGAACTSETTTEPTPETTPEPTAKPTAPEPTTPATTPASTVESCANDADDRDYRGTISVTQTGATCQKWTAQSPHSHGVTPETRPDKGLGDHNYCRNPSTNQPHAWCYNADGQSGAGGTDRWDFCSIPKCASNNNGGTSASLAMIIPVVIAAVLLLAAVLFLVRKRVVAARQHRRESMPTVGDEDEAEVEA